MAKVKAAAERSADVARLTTKARAKLPASDFALPGRRFPVEDKAHARAALSRASQGVNAGTLSLAERGQIDRKARAKLKGKQ